MRLLILATPQKAVRLHDRLLPSGPRITLAQNSAQLVLLIRNADPDYDLVLLQESLASPALLRSLQKIRPDLPLALLPERRPKPQTGEAALITIYHRDPQAE